MDINIKYKEVDKKAEIEKIVNDIKERTNRGFIHNSTSSWVGVIESVYKEDSKQIESVEFNSRYTNEFRTIIRNDGETVKIIYADSCGCNGIRRTYNKSELSQYINLLQQIEKQMT
jgi:hypothetical protein